MSQNIRAEIIFGVELDGNQARLDPEFVRLALAKINDIAIDVFGGVTWSETIGSWRNEQGRLYKESGRTIVIFAPDSRTHEITGFAKLVRDCLKQTCVALSITQVNFSFV